jgi:hypothetical protein
MGIGAGVDFADAHADARRRLDLRQFGVDEDAGDDAGVGQPGHDLAQARFLPGDVEPALGGDLVPAFRHQHGHFRLERAGDADHFIGRGHFQIQLDVRQSRAGAAHRGPGCGGGLRADAR